MQRKGKYEFIIDNYSGLNQYQKSKNLLNYIHDALEIKITKNMGRGVFATREIYKNELVIIEKPIVY